MNGQLQVDLAALVANYQLFCAQNSVPGNSVGGVVKADGYGLGVARVSQALYGAGCREFFVATCEEGVELRGVLADATIYVFEGSTPDNASRLAAASLIPVVNHAGQLEAWRPHRQLPIAVHVDTGMARLGFAEDLVAQTVDGFGVVLLLTHLACADTPEHPFNAEQIHRFDAVRSRFRGVRTSIGNSAGLLLGASFSGDLGRPGIGLYGGNPFAERANPMNCVATLSAQVLQVREVPAGSALGYGASYVAPHDLAVATVGLGYADGLPRVLSNRGAVSVNGERCAIVGRISMDLTLIDVTGIEIAAGDWVQIFGAELSVDEVGGLADSFAYELLTGIGRRVERVYLNG
ncbi:MAG: alanine racemase [Gammaproteobacteria bacterium]|nr:alanine racemase [Gammaproteobacteria bacterium]